MVLLIHPDLVIIIIFLFIMPHIEINFHTISQNKHNLHLNNSAERIRLLSRSAILQSTAVHVPND